MAELRFITKHYRQRTDIEKLTTQINKRFHKGEPVRTVRAVYTKAGHIHATKNIERAVNSFLPSPAGGHA